MVSSVDNTSRFLGSLELQVNRLSGKFPPDSDIKSIESLSVLRGNLFDCENIPPEDEYSDQYTCGSEDLDISLYIFLCIFFTKACINTTDIVTAYVIDTIKYFIFVFLA